MRPLLAALLLLAVACTPARRDDDEDPGSPPDETTETPDAGEPPPTGHPDAGTPPGTLACRAAEDCPYWYCNCQNGPPVNTRHCTDGLCETAPQACPTSCRNFGTCWLGTAGGGWEGASNAGRNDCPPPPPPPTNHGCNDDTAFTDLGRPCASGRDCGSALCYGVPSYSTICTKRCTTSANCPDSWRCITSGDGLKICMIGTTAAGEVSTNTECAQRRFSDVGQSCSSHSQCQSDICMNAGYCSARCETSANCPSNLHCGAVNGGQFQACLK